MNPRLPATLAILILLGGVGARSANAAGLVIDDFEYSGYSLYGDGSTSCQYPPAVHAAFGQRCVFPSNLYGIATASQQSTSADDAAVITTTGTHAWVEFNWASPDSTPLNFREGGADRIIVRLKDATPETLGTIFFYDAFGQSDLRNTYFSGGPEEWTINLAELSVNTAGVKRVRLILEGWGDAVIELADIRTVRAGAWMQWFATTWTEFLFPGPSPPCDWTIYDPSFGTPLQGVQMSFPSVLNGGGTGAPVPIRLLADSQASVAGAQAWWDNPGVFFDSPRFEVLVAMTPGELTNPGMVTALPTLTTGFDTFALTMPLVHRNGGGHVIGNSMQEITFTQGQGQELYFTDVEVDIVSAFGGGADNAYLVSFTVEAEGNFELDYPLWEMTLVQDYGAGAGATDVTMGALPPDSGPRNELRASPSVTRSGTQWQFARPTSGPSTVHLFDVAGRLVHRMDVAAGSSGAAWDGRLADGRSAPGGLYFARMREGAATANARVVVIR